MRTLVSFTFISVFILTLIFGCTSSLAWAQPKDLCAEKIIDSGTFEGVYAGVDCGDYCTATFILANDEKVNIDCDEDDATKYFGDIGNKVSVSYEIRQYWNDISDLGYIGCSRDSIVVNGKILVVGADPTIKKMQEEQAKIENENLQEQQRSAPSQSPLLLRKVDWVNELIFTATEEGVVITTIIINRGNCNIPFMRGPVNTGYQSDDTFPMKLKFGDSLRCGISCGGSLLEVVVETKNHGTWTWTF